MASNPITPRNGLSDRFPRGHRNEAERPADAPSAEATPSATTRSGSGSGSGATAAKGSDPIDREAAGLHASGYVSGAQQLWYGIFAPIYDAYVGWCFLPLGGEHRVRQWIVDRVDAHAGHDVLSLCCGTGTTDRALRSRAAAANIVGVDLGTGQIARARRKDRTRTIDYQVGDASSTGLPAGSFHRVLIGLALHEMPRELRLCVLREARRVCRPDGRVVAVEHAAMERGLSRTLRSLWWVYWLPGNPERRTTLDLQRRGLANEMAEAGLTVVERRVTRPAWIEAIAAVPRAGATD